MTVSVSAAIEIATPTATPRSKFVGPVSVWYGLRKELPAPPAPEPDCPHARGEHSICPGISRLR